MFGAFAPPPFFTLYRISQTSVACPPRLVKLSWFSQMFSYPSPYSWHWLTTPHMEQNLDQNKIQLYHNEPYSCMSIYGAENLEEAKLYENWDKQVPSRMIILTLDQLLLGWLPIRTSFVQPRCQKSLPAQRLDLPESWSWTGDEMGWWVEISFRHIGQGILKSLGWAWQH